jgi:hypothetical protein
MCRLARLELESNEGNFKEVENLSGIELNF